MKIKPCGYYVLVDVTPAETVTKGGIVLPDELTKKEQMAEETGTIIAFGPTAYVGMRGCEAEGLFAYEQWGLKVGDKVEFKKYEGKRSFVKGKENYRYIPDTHIMGVIADE
jgi:co-chaperonin GroES (HSP10)